jgi:hypothetical protein
MTQMRRMDEAFERRDYFRISRRIPCALLEGGRRHDGVVREISPSCLLVQTSADLGEGAPVVVSLEMPGDGMTLLQAFVRERRAVARSLSSCTWADTVLKVDAPPAAWLRWVDAEIEKES